MFFLVFTLFPFLSKSEVNACGCYWASMGSCGSNGCPPIARPVQYICNPPFCSPSHGVMQCIESAACFPAPTYFTVSFNGNEGSCAPADRTIQEGSGSQGPSSCTREGYELTHFTASPGCGGLNATTGSCSAVMSNSTVTANWEVINLETTRIKMLFVEDDVNPVGVFVEFPKFKITFLNASESSYITRFRVQVSRSENFTDDLVWDSGLQEVGFTDVGDHELEIDYGGEPLLFDGTPYYWRAQFEDNEENESDWTDNQGFVMGVAMEAPSSEEEVEDTDEDQVPISEATTSQTTPKTGIFSSTTANIFLGILFLFLGWFVLNNPRGKVFVNSILNTRVYSSAENTYLRLFSPKEYFEKKIMKSSRR